jgi:hypothetical protein
MMQLGKTAQYAVSAVLAVYVVFFTRPAPGFVVQFLSSPIAQLAVLALIVYVGASMSLLVALVAAVALVLSIPSREYLDAKEMKEDAKDVLKAAADAATTAGSYAAAKKVDKVAKKLEKKAGGEPAALSSESAMMKSGSSDKGTEKFSIESFAPF